MKQKSLANVLGRVLQRLFIAALAGQTHLTSRQLVKMAYPLGKKTPRGQRYGSYAYSRQYCRTLW